MNAEQVVNLLEPLDIRCVAKNEDALRFETPSFRPDLTRERDLIEELARRYGYDNIPERLPSTGGPVLGALPQSVVPVMWHAEHFEHLGSMSPFITLLGVQAFTRATHWRRVKRFES